MAISGTVSTNSWDKAQASSDGIETTMRTNGETVLTNDNPFDTEQALGRLRTLRHEITAIAQMNEQHRAAGDISIAELQAHEQRRERLRQIVEELRNMQVNGNGTH
jgi:hypothetical protein